MFKLIKPKLGSLGLDSSATIDQQRLNLINFWITKQSEWVVSLGRLGSKFDFSSIKFDLGQPIDHLVITIMSIKPRKRTIWWLISRIYQTPIRPMYQSIECSTTKCIAANPIKCRIIELGQLGSRITKPSSKFLVVDKLLYQSDPAITILSGLIWISIGQLWSMQAIEQCFLSPNSELTERSQLG